MAKLPKVSGGPAEGRGHGGCVGCWTGASHSLWERKPNAAAVSCACGVARAGPEVDTLLTVLNLRVRPYFC